MSVSARIAQLADEAFRQHEFPVCQRRIYFAHAAVAPLPRTVAEAMIAYIRTASEGGQKFEAALQQMSETRALAAQLIGCGADEIALLGPTSLGLNLIAQGLDWKNGDEVVCYADDYPANVYPWMDLRRRGVRLVYLKPERLGAITPDVVEAALTARTRLVALSSTHFVSGFRVDLAGIGALLKTRDVLFAVDAIQTLGASPICVANVDFLSAGAQKWLLGPEGAGILYVKKSRWEHLRPALVGATNVVSTNDIASDEINFVPGAQRYEPTIMNVPGMIGMKAALDMVLEFRDEIPSRIFALKEKIIVSLESLGFEFLGPARGASVSGITTCFHPRIPSKHFVEILHAGDVAVSLRSDRAGKDYVRISPHFYNTSEEVAKMIEMLHRAV
ncbi:MAG: aminotransferase class V-fold PLP-dependent enzyme [Verrucomicrobiota bacterium]